MIEQIKELRIKIDGIAQLTKQLIQIASITVIKLPIEEQELFIENWKKSAQFKSFSTIENCSTIQLNPIPIEDASKSLLIAKAWGGKMLQELGTENPYGSGYKTKEDIVPTQDTYSISKLALQNNNLKEYFSASDSPNINWSEKNHIEKVDWLRTEIEKIVEEVKALKTSLFENKGGVMVVSSLLSREFAIARTNCYTHLCEARFHLGFELARVREEK